MWVAAVAAKHIGNWTAATAALAIGKIAEMLRSTAGWMVNDKRVERIWHPMAESLILRPQ
jgi:hypothetical protein